MEKKYIHYRKKLGYLNIFIKIATKLENKLMNELQRYTIVIKVVKTSIRLSSEVIIEDKYKLIDIITKIMLLYKCKSI